MTTLEIDEQLAERLRSIAAQRGQPLDEWLNNVVEREEQSISIIERARAAARQNSPEFYQLLKQMTQAESRELMLGLFDDDVSDLSTTIRETIAT